MYVLGIWDGHDAGAAIVRGKNILMAVNEERFTKNKLEVGFPVESIKCCLSYLKIKPAEIKHIAVNTSDVAKTLTRLLPGVKKHYYLFRRRKLKPSFVNARREFKYKITEFPPNFVSRAISKSYFKKELKKLGFKDFELYLVDHHMAHAAAAAFTSGFDKAVVITLDGVGDGLSGSVNLFKDGKIKRLSGISAKASLGIFFEQATNLMGMRELEDEGKLMALSDYSYKIPDEKNPLLKLFWVDGLTVKTKYSTWKRYRILQDLAWRTPHEDFAFMVQKTLEKNALQLFQNAVKATKVRNVAWAGGVASNIKSNMLVRKYSGLKEWYVFPHMGDGGLALGSALYVNNIVFKVKRVDFKDAYLGPDYSDKEIRDALKSHKELKFTKVKDIATQAADAVCDNEVVMWFQGRLEFGPRALGNRSILASASSKDVKDKLNVQLKRRDWFQPFCPSLLAEEADRLFENVGRPDHFMTMGYMARPEMLLQVIAVVNVDNSARPQMITDENPLYRKLLERVKERTGYGIILNTSFNIHGDPIVNTPEDAIKAMNKGGAKFLAIGDYWVEAKH